MILKNFGMKHMKFIKNQINKEIKVSIKQQIITTEINKLYSQRQELISEFNKIISRSVGNFLPKELGKIWKINKKSFKVTEYPFSGKLKTKWDADLRTGYYNLKYLPEGLSSEEAHKILLNSDISSIFLSLKLEIPIEIRDNFFNEFFDSIDPEDLLKLENIYKEYLSILVYCYIFSLDKYTIQGEFLKDIDTLDDLKMWFPELVPYVKDNSSNSIIQDILTARNFYE